VSPPTSSPEAKNWRKGGYLGELPYDPWQTPYLYEGDPGTGKPYEIYTLGADGVRGGDDEATDISNWAQPGGNGQ